MSNSSTTAPHIGVIYDKAHRSIGTISYNIDSGSIAPLQPSGDPYYMQIGCGDEVIVAASVEDAFILHSTNLSSCTICPLVQSEIAAVCNSLQCKYPKLKFLFLGIYSCSQEIRIAKDDVGGNSIYPDRNYTTWAEAYRERGLDYLTSYITDCDHEAAAIDAYSVTSDQVMMIENQRFIFPNLIISQHIVIICSPPNGGKTTLMNWVCGQISEENDVRYVNMDCSGAEMKEYQQYATDNNFTFINFDITSTSLTDFFVSLDAAPSLKGKVYVLDTLKKVADPMRKGSMSNFMKMLRALCIKGATFVLLAHTNKYDGKDGIPIYEGVGDVRSDCDELIYLIPTKNADGSTAVSTVPDKVRGRFEPISFLIDANRNVSLTDHVDAISALQQKANQDVIDLIRAALSSGLSVQRDLVDHCQQRGCGKHRTTKILQKYSQPPDALWTRTNGPHNSWVYQII